MMSKRSSILPILLILLAGGHAKAGSVVGGGSGSYNNFPFGASNLYQGEYQQIYSSSIFSGPVAINSVAFESDGTRGNGGSGTSGTVDVTLSLSTTAASSGAPSTNYASNEGSDFTTVFSGTVTYVAQKIGTFDLVFPTSAFVYDPSKGNLLLDLVITSVVNAGGNIPFVDGQSTLSSRVYNSNGNGAPTVDQVTLLTQFGTSAVPEPASVVMVATGLAVGLCYRLRRRGTPRIAR